MGRMMDYFKPWDEMVGKVLAACREEQKEYVKTKFQSFVMRPESADYYIQAEKGIHGNDGPFEIVGIPIVTPLGEAKQHVLEDYVNNWFYDRELGTVVFNLHGGSHEQMAAALWRARRGHFGEPKSDLAEKYIKAGLGFWRSSVSHKATKADDVRLSFQERKIFEGVVFEQVFN